LAETSEARKISQNQDRIFSKIFRKLKGLITKPGENPEFHKTMISTLKWVDSLLDYFPEEIKNFSADVIKNLKSSDQKIVETSVDLIAMCVVKRNELYLLDDVISCIEKIAIDDSYNSRIFVIIRSLCKEINGEKLITYMAEIILKKTSDGLSNFFSNTSKDTDTKDWIPIYQIVIRNLDLALNIEESMSAVRLKLKRTGRGNSQES
jgi:hypothetical protein